MNSLRKCRGKNQLVSNLHCRASSLDQEMEREDVGSRQGWIKQGRAGQVKHLDYNLRSWLSPDFCHVAMQQKLNENLQGVLQQVKLRS